MRRWEALNRSLQRVDVVHDNRAGTGAGLPLDKVRQPEASSQSIWDPADACALQHSPLCTCHHAPMCLRCLASQTHSHS
jgi:hypothetical protein